MIQLGKPRTVQVRKRINGKLIAVGGEKTIPREVWVTTKDELGGHFGPDKHRQLVVGLTNGDVLVMYPKGTRQRVSVLLKDVYTWALRSKALKSQLEKARERKARLAERRETRRREAAERRLSLAAKRDREN